MQYRCSMMAISRKFKKQSLTLKDKISIEHKHYNGKSNKQLSLDEFLAMKLKIQ